MYKIKLLNRFGHTRIHRTFATQAEAHDYARSHFIGNYQYTIFKSRVVRKLPIAQTDGGRIDGETRDCTVRALTVTTPLTYQEAHQVMQQHGRAPRHGLSTYRIREALRSLADRGIISNTAYDWTNIGAKRMTLGQFIDQHPTGNYYIVIRSHALGVVNGVIHDTFRSGRRCRIELAVELKA